MLDYCTTQFAKRQLFCSKKMKQKHNNLLFEAKRATREKVRCPFEMIVYDWIVS